MRQIDLTIWNADTPDPARTARLTRHLKARLEDFGPGGPQVVSADEETGAVTARFPWIAAVEVDVCGGERIVGYAYAAPMAERMAYIWSADMSIYLDRSCRGQGIGTMLCTKLEELLRRCGYYNAYALITAENEPSRCFHAHMGYTPESHMDRCGYKMGRWLAVDWYVKRLREGEPTELPQKWNGEMTDA